MNTLTAQDLLLDAMEEKALELGLNGVGVAYVIDPVDEGDTFIPSIVVVGRFHRGPKPDTKGDNGANYAAVALAKFAQMLRTGEDSGTDAVKGEFAYRGGVIREVAGRKVMVAFSGGTQEEDVAIAEYAVASLEDDLHFRQWHELPLTCLEFVVYTH